MPSCSCWPSVWGLPPRWSRGGSPIATASVSCILHRLDGGPSFANIVLAAAAGFVLAEGLHQPGASAVAWLSQLDGAEVASLVAGIVVMAAVGGLGWFSLELLRQNGRILLRLDELEVAVSAGGGAVVPELFDWERRAQGLRVGSKAPDFDLVSLGGGKRTLKSLLADGQPAMLVFADPGCGPCQALLPDLSKWQRQHASRLTVAMISRGDIEANQAKADEHRVQNILIQVDREVSTSYQAHGTPSALLVSPEGLIASAVAPGALAISQLVDRHLGMAPTRIPLRATPVAPDTSQVGQEIPALTLSDLNGRDFELSGLRGQDTLVLFWNPACGFCQKMLPTSKHGKRVLHRTLPILS